MPRRALAPTRRPGAAQPLIGCQSQLFKRNLDARSPRRATRAAQSMVRDLTMAEAVDMPIGAPTRFKVGDRVECRCGEAWYPATVVQIWYTPTFTFHKLSRILCPSPRTAVARSIVTALRAAARLLRVARLQREGPAVTRDLRRGRGVIGATREGLFVARFEGFGCGSRGSACGTAS